jgi:hypothetical protein
MIYRYYKPKRVILANLNSTFQSLSVNNVWPKLIHEIDSSPFVTTLPFKTCDESNLGISRFCNLDDENLPEPKIWGQQESIL